MTILVTGGGGFIGYHICKRLLDSGYDVIGLDDLNNYYDPTLKANRLLELKKYKKFKLFYMDIFNLKKKYLKDVDIIFHEAGYAGVRASIEQPVLYEKVNSLGTVHLLKLAVGSNIKKFIYASSSSVYGNVKKFPTSEDEPTHPISPYGVSKLAGELYCRAFSKCYGIDSMALRYFTVYGPWGRPDMLILKSILAIKNNKPIYDFGINYKRDFTYIDDIVEANMLAMKKARGFDFMNIGSGRVVTIKSVLNIIESGFGKKIPMVKKEPPASDPVKTLSSIKKAKKVLGYKPKTCIKEGLKKTIEWAKEYYGGI